MQKMVNVIILSLERFEQTKACVESLLNSGDTWLFDITIVDNGSDIDTTAKLAKLYGPKYVLYNLKNMGVGQARKQGVRYGCYPYFIFLDNDMTVNEGYVKHLLGAIKQADDIAAVCSRVELNGSVQLCGRSIVNGRIDYSTDNVPLDHPETRKYRYCDIIHGGSTIYRRSAYDQVEFDNTYFVGYEDLDMMMQFRKLKLKLSYCPSSIAYHTPTGDSKYNKIRRDSKKILEAKKYFEKKWGIKT